MKHASFSFALLGLVLSCSRATPGVSISKEAPDSRNTVAKFELGAMPSYEDIQATKQVFTSRIPWSDTYWPLTQAGLARRWGTVSNERSNVSFTSFWKDQLSAVQSSSFNPNLSPAEKYDILYRLRWNKATDEAALNTAIEGLAKTEASLADASDLNGRRAVITQLFNEFSKAKALASWSPMAAEGWNRWLSYTKNPNYQYRDEKDSGEDWSWMGYCHGWAPAALMHEAPKHSVLAKIDGKEIFFGEGDIRGLLTKAWADHSPSESQYFLGRRCNENTADPHGEIPMAGDTRGATGTYVDASGATRTFTMVDEYLPGAAASGRRIYQITVQNDSSPEFLIEKTSGGKVYYYLSRDLPSMKTFVENGQTQGFENVGSVKFYGCWDVNPASFHSILTEYLGKKNMGFVMDRTRTGQVWNQPVYGARFNVGPLLEAAATDDALFRYRAPGTTYLSVVTAEVLWSSEPSRPQLDYAPTFDKAQLSSLKYTYTLEFDAEHRLIGGEWGDLKAKDTKLVIPDFLYAFKAGSEPKDQVNAGFDYSGILKPLHACSLDDSQVKTMKVNGKSVEYSECEIGKGL